jgi:hypothetical protein
MSPRPEATPVTSFLRLSHDSLLLAGRCTESARDLTDQIKNSFRRNHLAGALADTQSAGPSIVRTQVQGTIAGKRLSTESLS